MGYREWYRLAGLAVFALLLFVTIYHSIDRGAEAQCVGIRVRVVDSAQLGFLTPKRVVGHVRRIGASVEGQQLRGINTHRVEQHLRGIPSVGSAEAYVDCQGLLNVVVSQRHPLFRIMGRDGRSCYVDAEGRTFPLDAIYSAHTLVVSGHIDTPPQNSHLADSLTMGSFWSQLHSLALFIDGRPEWRALIAQVYVLSPQRVELVPRVGGFIINLGSLDRVSYKFDKLRSIYRASLPGEGLGAYSVVDLAYGAQVVCVRRGERFKS